MASFAPITDLVPHRPPMLLIDRIVDSDTARTVGEVKVNEQAPFYINELGVPSWVALEYAGQVSAAYFSLQAQPTQQAVATPGMLISCKTLKTDVEYFRAGTLLQVQAMPLSALTGQMVQFKGQVYEKDSEPLVSVEFSVYMRGVEVGR